MVWEMNFLLDCQESSQNYTESSVSADYICFIFFQIIIGTLREYLINIFNCIIELKKSESHPIFIHKYRKTSPMKCEL